VNRYHVPDLPKERKTASTPLSECALALRGHYNSPMPAYVVRIQPKPIDDRPFGHLVDYSDNPDWQFSTFDAAAQWRDVLTGMKVTVGTHLCQFEVEEFKPRFFAIVCSSHPTKPGFIA